MKRNPNALVPSGSHAARNLFNFMRMAVQEGVDCDKLPQRTSAMESPRKQRVAKKLFGIENSLPIGDR